MSDTQQERLEAEFPTARLGSVTKGGTKLTYVPASEVIQRLNDVLGLTAWSWETVRVWRDEVDPDWVLAVGKMTATIDGVTSVKAGEGGVKVKKLKDGVTLVDLGDEFKGAASDALKKAAQKFGVALYLARTDQAKRYEEPAPVREPTDEGWASTEEADHLISEFSASVKACSDDVRQVMRHVREREVAFWPPTRDEYDTLVRELAEAKAAEANGAASQTNETPTEPPPAMDTAADPVRGSHGEPDRYTAACAFVNALDKATLVGSLTDLGLDVPRTLDAQRTLLVTSLVESPDWQPTQGAML